jgi:hypothetical protein
MKWLSDEILKFFRNCSFMHKKNRICSMFVKTNIRHLEYENILWRLLSSILVFVHKTLQSVISSILLLHVDTCCSIWCLDGVVAAIQLLPGVSTVIKVNIKCKGDPHSYTHQWCLWDRCEKFNWAIRCGARWFPWVMDLHHFNHCASVQHHPMFLKCFWREMQIYFQGTLWENCVWVWSTASVLLSLTIQALPISCCSSSLASAALCSSNSVVPTQAAIPGGRRGHISHSPSVPSVFPTVQTRPISPPLLQLHWGGHDPSCIEWDMLPPPKMFPSCVPIFQTRSPSLLHCFSSIRVQASIASAEPVLFQPCSGISFDPAVMLLQYQPCFSSFTVTRVREPGWGRGWGDPGRDEPQHSYHSYQISLISLYCFSCLILVGITCFSS